MEPPFKPTDRVSVFAPEGDRLAEHHGKDGTVTAVDSIDGTPRYTIAMDSSAVLTDVPHDSLVGI